MQCRPLSAAATLFIMACAEATGPTSPTLDIDVQNPRSTLEVGESVRFEAIVRDRVSGARSSVPVRWSSSNPAVVSIDSTGLAVAQGRGSSYSTVSASIDNSTSVRWSVHVIRIFALQIQPDSVLLFPWEQASVKVTPVDSFGDAVFGWGALAAERRDSVVWSLEDTMAARLGEGPGWPGVVGLREGHTTLNVELLGRTATANVIVRALDFTALAARGPCALATDSLPYCWGQWQGPWGSPVSYLDPNFEWWMPTFVPHRVAHSPKLVSLSASCGLTTDGRAYCWGPDYFGELGLGTTEQQTGAVQVSGGLQFLSLSSVNGLWGGVGIGDGHTCGVTPDGAIYCWGNWQWGHAPQECLVSIWKTPLAIPCTLTPTRLGDTSVTFVSISAGESHTCGLDRGGHAYCWLGDAGDPVWLSRDTVVPTVMIDSTLTFTTVTSADGFSCALGLSGSAYCWGSNTHGTLGIGGADQPTGVVPVAGNLHFASISARGSHTCAVTTDGIVYCWGWNGHGEVGIPPAGDVTLPTQVATDIRFRSVEAGYFITCGLSVDGIVYCWGSNSSGALGTPEEGHLWTPMPVVGQRP